MVALSLSAGVSGLVNSGSAIAGSLSVRQSFEAQQGLGDGMVAPAVQRRGAEALEGGDMLRAAVAFVLARP